MYITENIIDIGTEKTVETYGEIYPKNAEYMAVIERLKASSDIISREVTSLGSFFYQVKTVFKDEETYRNHLVLPEVADMITWMKDHNITVFQVSAQTV